MDDKEKGFARNVLKVGTPECAVFSGAVAMVLALLLLTIGFWKTLLVALCVCVGVFVGGVEDKQKMISRVVNRLFPPKAAVPLQSTKEDAERVEELRREAQKKAAEQDEATQPEETKEEQ